MLKNISPSLMQGIIFFINQAPGVFILKDLNSVYITGCKKVTSVLGYKTPDQLCGLTDYTVSHEVANYGDMFHSQDQKLKQQGKAITGFNVIEMDGEIKSCIVNKYFLKDEEGEKVGIVSHNVQVKDPRFLKKLITLAQMDNYYLCKNAASYIVDQYSGLGLSRRQAQCLFYIIRGKSAANIAQLLKLSVRTVESYIDEIKTKMNCANKSEIIENVIANNLIDVVPPGILS